MGQGVDFRAVTESNREAWGLGDYQQIANKTVTLNEDLVRAVDPRPGQRVLDVACGSGNAALAAARRECGVVGIDFVPRWLERARQRAEVEGLAVRFEVADAQELPFEDASFDVVISALGVMFAPDQQTAAAELMRVCKPGGKIGLAAWSPEGLFGHTTAALADLLPASAEGLESPLRWGTEEGVEQLLGDGARTIQHQRRFHDFYSRSPEEDARMRGNYLGPMVGSLRALTSDQRDAVLRALIEALDSFNRADDGTFVADAEYLQTIAVRA
jgi:ubiquinone/menaquinone biosynthesis C-methylase UbiE